LPHEKPSAEQLLLEGQSAVAIEVPTISANINPIVNLNISHLLMFGLFKHTINLTRHYFRDMGIAPKRSTHWKTLEHHFLQEHPICEACGTHIRVQVHHKKPFHIHPELELNTTNLISLCMSRRECHLWIGHGGNFKEWNPKVEDYAAMIRNGTKPFDEVKALSIAAKVNQ
jgi:5-methylcytosine-specific restriction enzyme A